METRLIEVKRLGDLYDPTPPLSRDIYYCFIEDEGKTVAYLAHVCTHSGEPRWIWQGTNLHTLVSRDPLHLEASIGWVKCCGRHGFIRNGQWEPSGDGGWFP
jgi:hypothetical protein